MKEKKFKYRFEQNCYMERHKIVDDVTKIKNNIFISFIYISHRDKAKGEETNQTRNKKK